MVKKLLLSAAAAAFVFGGSAVIQSSPAEASGWHDRGAAVAGHTWRDRWRAHWAEKKERKRMRWAEKKARKGWGHRRAAVATVAPAPAPRYAPMK